MEEYEKREKPDKFFSDLFSVGDYLSYRAVASRVLLAKMSLTSVFDMGTGGTSSQSSPTKAMIASKLNKDKGS